MRLRANESCAGPPQSTHSNHQYNTSDPTGDDYQHMVEVFPLEPLHAANMARTMALVPSENGVEGDMLSGGWVDACGLNDMDDDLEAPASRAHSPHSPIHLHTHTALILGFTMLHDRTGTVKVDRRMVILTDGCSRIGSAEGLDAVVGGVRWRREASERASDVV